MKILFTFCFVLFALFCYSQTKEEIIKNIRKEFKAINSDTTLKIISRTGDDDAFDGDFEAKGYFRNKKIIKIYVWVGLSYGNRVREFYFKDGDLIFVYEKFDSFIETKDGLDHSKTKKSFEGRYYFNKRSLFERTITGKKPLADENADIEKELKDDATEQMQQLYALNGVH